MTRRWVGNTIRINDEVVILLLASDGFDVTEVPGNRSDLFPSPFEPVPDSVG